MAPLFDHNSRDVIKDRIKATLLGLAIGDAFGAPVEGKLGDEIRVLYTRREDKEAPYTPQPLENQGLYTDDTQLALCLLVPIMETGEFNPIRAKEAIATLSQSSSAYRDLQELGVLRGCGTNAKRSIHKMREDRPWTECGVPTAGVGAAMRVAPLAAYYSVAAQYERYRQAPKTEVEDPAQLVHRFESVLIEQVLKSALLTHKDPRGIAGAIAIAAAVSFLISHGPSFSPVDLLDYVHSIAFRLESALINRPSLQRLVLLPRIAPPKRSAGHGERDMWRPSKKQKRRRKETGEERGVEGEADTKVLHQVSRAVKRLKSVHAIGLERGAESVMEWAGKESVHTDLRVYSPTQGFVLCSVMTALLAVCSGQDYVSSLSSTVELGGDTDTMCAMVGAMVGAASGTSCLPSAWTTSLCNGDHLERLGGCLSELATGETALQDSGWSLSSLVDMETNPVLPSLS